MAPFHRQVESAPGSCVSSSSSGNNFLNTSGKTWKRLKMVFSLPENILEQGRSILILDIPCDSKVQVMGKRQPEKKAAGSLGRPLSQEAQHLWDEAMEKCSIVWA